MPWPGAPDWNQGEARGIGTIQKKLASLTDRINNLYTKSGMKPREPGTAGKQGDNLQANICLAIIIPTQMSTLLGSMLGLASIMEIQFNVHRVPAEWLTATALALVGTALLGITLQALFILWVNTKLTAMEDQLNLQIPRAIATFLEERHPERYRVRSHLLLSRIGGARSKAGAT